jgi:hyperosmotically inducible periplasmic protein
MKMMLVSSVLLAAMASQAMAQSTPAPDNTGSNAAPANSAMQGPTTADGQSNMASDVKLSQRIRKSVMADKNLSTYAHNVKIVSVNGAVTLNGVVKTAHEKSVVAMKAQAIAGKGNVTNDLTVAPNS